MTKHYNEQLDVTGQHVFKLFMSLCDPFQNRQFIMNFNLIEFSYMQFQLVNVNLNRVKKLILIIMINKNSLAAILYARVFPFFI